MELISSDWPNWLEIDFHWWLFPSSSSSETCLWDHHVGKNADFFLNSCNSSRSMCLFVSVTIFSSPFVTVIASWMRSIEVLIRIWKFFRQIHKQTMRMIVSYWACVLIRYKIARLSSDLCVLICESACCYNRTKIEWLRHTNTKNSLTKFDK